MEPEFSRTGARELVRDERRDDMIRLFELMSTWKFPQQGLIGGAS